VPESPFLAELLLALATAAVGVSLFERVRLPLIAGFLRIGAPLGPDGLALAPARPRCGGWPSSAVFLLSEVGLELLFEAPPARDRRGRRFASRAQRFGLTGRTIVGELRAARISY
jgi:hypothetical protein